LKSIENSTLFKIEFEIFEIVIIMVFMIIIIIPNVIERLILPYEKPAALLQDS